MRIGINALFLRPGKNGGIETYFNELLKAMTEVAPFHQYVAYVPLEARNYRVPDCVRLVVVPVRAARPAEKYAFEQSVLPFYVLRDGIEVLHSLAYVAPLRVHCASVVTVHDLNFKAFGKLLGASRRIALSAFCYTSCCSVDAIIAVSDFTRRSLEVELDIPRQKIVMIHEAGADIVSRLCEPVSLPKKYITSFGGRFPNKNVARLLHAFARIAGESEHDLVLMGQMHPAFVPVLQQLPEWARAKVHWLGTISDGQVATVLRHAAAYIHPSIYEGFGMPILEAQSLDVAVASSNVSSLPEIGGQGAFYFDPLSVEDMARAISAVVSNGDLRRDLIDRARRNVRRFSWTASAQKTLALYSALLGDGRRYE